MLDFLSLLVAIVALIVARKTFHQGALPRARLQATEARGGRASAPPPRFAPYQAPEPAPPASSPEIAAEPPTVVADTESIAPIANAEGGAPKAAAGGATTTPPPLPQPQLEPGFEERIGTRWVVWVGGLTLALGGFFMVRYSIEAGLLGPGVRTLLGGGFALGLLAAGGWTRPQ